MRQRQADLPWGVVSKSLRSRSLKLDEPAALCAAMRMVLSKPVAVIGPRALPMPGCCLGCVVVLVNSGVVPSLFFCALYSQRTRTVARYNWPHVYFHPQRLRSLPLVAGSGVRRVFYPSLAFYLALFDMPECGGSSGGHVIFLGTQSAKDIGDPHGAQLQVG